MIVNNINPEIFRAYDIRGIYPDEINKDTAHKIGAAFCGYLRAAGKKKNLKVVLGRDARVSSPELHKAFAEGCMAAGCDIVDIGLSTTPMMYFAVNFLKADGGAIITASHNPAQYNGVKLVDHAAAPISPSEILKLLPDGADAVAESGVLQKIDIKSAYIDFLASFSHDGVTSNFRLVADASNGAGGELLKMLFSKLAVSYWPLYFDPDGRFPNHSPNPLEGEAAQRARELVIHKGADFGFVLDADGDRIVFIDEHGQSVRGDLIAALMVGNILQKGDKALVDSASSRAVFDTGREKSIEVLRAKTGHLNIKRAMKETGSALAGEVSGHYYFKDFFGADSALLALVQVLNIVSASRKTFSALLEPYQIYFHSREYNYKLPDLSRAGEILDALSEKYADGKQGRMDGLTVEYADWWFNARRSETEPLLRLNLEASKKSLLEEKIQELTTFINRYQH